MENKSIREFVKSTDFMVKLLAAIENLQQSDFSVFEGLQDFGRCGLNISFNGKTVQISAMTPILEQPNSEEKIEVDISSIKETTKEPPKPMEKPVRKNK